MMREIKYRQAIFHPVTKEFLKWHYWGLIDKAFIGVDTGWQSPSTATENSYQYTGLKDKNGKEIYEGDIVSHPLCVSEPHDVDEACETFVGRIQFEVDRGQWFAVNTKRNGYVIVMSEAYKFEVIGNIYENKELLKC